MEEETNGAFRLSRKTGDILKVCAAAGAVISTVFVVYVDYNKQLTEQSEKTAALASRLGWLEESVKEGRSDQRQADKDAKDRLDALLDKVHELGLLFARGNNATPTPPRR